MTLESLFATLYRDGQVRSPELPQIAFTDQSGPCIRVC